MSNTKLIDHETTNTFVAESDTTKLVIAGPNNQLSDKDKLTITIGLPEKVTQPVGGGQKHLLISLWVPTAILPGKLAGKQVKSERLDGDATGVRVDGSDGWQAWSAVDTNKDVLRIDVRNDQGQAGPWGSIEAGKPLTLSLPLQVTATDTTSGAHDCQILVKINARYVHGTFLPDGQPRGSLNVGVAPAAGVAAAAAARAPVVKLEAVGLEQTGNNLTAVAPGSLVRIKWEVENGVKGRLLGPLPGGDFLQLGTGTGDHWKLSKGSLTVRVMSQQTYFLQVEVNDGTQSKNDKVSRTLVLDALTENDFGYLTISPLDVLPYGEATAAWAAWGVKHGAKLMYAHDGSIIPLKLSRTSPNSEYYDGQGTIAFSIDKHNLDLQLRLTSKKEEVFNASVNVSHWIEAKVTSDVPIPADPLALCYAASESTGVLGLCAADGLWFASVGKSDPKNTARVGELHFQRLAPDDGVRCWDDMAAHGHGFAALRRLKSGRTELVQFNLNDKAGPRDIPVTVEGAPLTVPDDSYVIAAYGPNGNKNLRKFDDEYSLQIWNLDRANHDEKNPSPPERTISGRGAGLNAMALTPDGQRVVLGFDNHSLQVLDLADGSVVHTLNGHQGAVTAVAITPDSRRAVSASEDKTLKIWDLSTGREERTLKGHTYEVRRVAVTPDGRRVISVASHKRGKAWAIDNEYIMNAWEIDSGVVSLFHIYTSYYVPAMAITPDSRKVVFGAYEGFVHVWDLKSGAVKTLKEDAKLSEPTGGVEYPAVALGITPDGSRAIVGFSALHVQVWNLNTGALERTDEKISAPTDVAFSSDGKCVITGDRFNNTVNVWNLESRQYLGELKPPVGGSGVVAMGVTPSQRKLLSLGERMLVTSPLGWGVWHDPSPSASGFMRSPAALPSVLGCELLADHGTIFAVNRKTGELQAFALEGEKILSGHGAERLALSALTITSDGSRAVSIDFRGTLKVWDLDSGHERRSLSGLRDDTPHRGWGKPAVSPDGKFAVIPLNSERRLADGSSAEGAITIWDLETGKETKTIKAHDFEPRSLAVALTAHGARVISTAGGEIKVWDPASGALVHTLHDFGTQVAGSERIEEDVTAVVAARQYAVSCSTVQRFFVDRYGRRSEPRRNQPMDAVIKFWDLTSGKLLSSVTIPGGEQRTGVGITPDGRYAFATVASGKEKVSNRVWELSDRPGVRELRPIDGPIMGVYNGHFVRRDVPKGRNWDGTITIGNLATRQDEHSITLGSDVYSSRYYTEMAITPDGRRMISGPGDGGSLHVWDLHGRMAANASAITPTLLMQRQSLAPARDEDGQGGINGGVPVLVDGLLVVLGNGSYKAERESDDMPKVAVPQDWVYNPQHDRWHLCGHGLDIDPAGHAACRGGEALRLWAIGRTVGKHKEAAGPPTIHTLGLDGLHVFDPDYAAPAATEEQRE